jgi:hypothetical protein
MILIQDILVRRDDPVIKNILAIRDIPIVGAS